MLKSEITNFLVEGCKSNIEILVQQKGSKLSRCVANANQKSKREIYETIPPVEAKEMDLGKSRDKDTAITNTKRNRFISDLKTYEWADLIHREDKISSLGDPTSAYAVNAAYALGRAKDKAIIGGTLGEVSKMASDGEMSAPLNSGNKIPHSGKGLTVEKLRRARALFNEADIDPDDEQFIAVTGKQMSDLLKEIQNNSGVPSHESDVIQGLVEGRVKKFLGFTFKVVSSSLITSDSSNGAHIPVWNKSSVLLSTGKDISVDIQRRPDRRNAVQVYASMECAVIRLNDKGVYIIYCK